MPIITTIANLRCAPMALALAALLGAGSVAAEEAGGVKVIDSIVAFINDDVITRYRFEQEVGLMRGRMPPGSAIDFDSESVRRQLLQKMIDDNLVMQMAERAGIVIDELSMDSYMRQVAQSKEKSLTELREEVIASGMVFDEFRERLREELTRQRMIYGYVAGRIVVLDEEIDRYMKRIPEMLDDEFLLSRILIRSREYQSAKRIEEERETLAKYRQSSEEGAGFNELIALYSNDPSGINDGDLGWVSARNLPESYLDALLAMSKGEISEPLVLPSGIHILKLRDVRRRDAKIREEILLQRILIESRAERAPEYGKIKADFVYEQLAEGVEFTLLAQQYSDDVASSPAGGDIGWNSEGDLMPEVWQSLLSLRPGEFTNPILTPFGWEILQVLKRRDSDQTETLRRERARNNIVQSRLETELISWLREVRGGAYISIVDKSFGEIDTSEAAESSFFDLPASPDDLGLGLPSTPFGEGVDAEALD